MNLLIIILVTVTLFVIFLIIFLGYLKVANKNKKKEFDRNLRQQNKLEEELASNRKKLLTYIPSVFKALDQFTNLEDYASGYLNYSKFQNWKNEYKNLFLLLSKSNYNYTSLDEKDELAITSFLQKYNLNEGYTSERNNSFIELEENIYRSLFDNVENRKLDKQQIRAIITDEDNNLVIAGAGSGKTTTIIGKIKYLTHRYQIAASKILAISFTRKSSETLENRLLQEGIENVKVKTFHSFGLEVIRTSTGEIPRSLNDKEFTPLIERLFKNKLHDQLFLNNSVNFLTKHLRLTKDDFEFSTLKEKINFVKANVLKTIQGEIVKSKQELELANWLLFHGLQYEYEPLYPKKYQNAQGFLSQYRPDFKIKYGELEIYLEHFGINAEGNVPTFFRKETETQEGANEKYKKERLLKIDTHRINGTNLIQTFSHQFSSGDVFTHLEHELSNFGVIVKELPAEDQWKLIEENSLEIIKDVIQLFCTFITLQKSNNLSIDEIFNKAHKVQKTDIASRVNAFLELYKPIFLNYQSYLKEKQLIDFNDMINLATDYINNNQFYQKYDYIIVDEFQDISISRNKLLLAIKEKNVECKTFCVGDDWQSIFRFTGSDISLFTDFEQFFGVTAKSNIERTYRFSDPLIKISSQFILKNPNQISKHLSGTDFNQTTIEIRYSKQEDRQNINDSIEVSNILEELSLLDNIHNKTIFIIGRYNHDIKRIKNTNKLTVNYHRSSNNNIEDNAYEITFNFLSNAGIKFSGKYLTAHKSKGLEADIIIILNCNSGKYGFPSEVADDPILSLLLSKTDQFENSEERRLFYVAMTRAKKAVYLIADPYSKSKFINELETSLLNNQNNSTLNNCPLCMVGDVYLRKEGLTKKGDYYKFYGCSNYLFGCTYSQTEFIESESTTSTENEIEIFTENNNLGKNNIISSQPKQMVEIEGLVNPPKKQYEPTIEKKQKDTAFQSFTTLTEVDKEVNLSFIPHATKTSRSEIGSRIYSFKLNSPIDGFDTVMVHERDVHSCSNGFKYIEFANYPYKYNGKELNLVVLSLSDNKKELWLKRITE